jgi:hypothetical protein
MLCPECRGRLVYVDPTRTRCSVHGGEFRILFWRGAHGATDAESPDPSTAATATAGTPPPIMCASHPRQPAVRRCNVCGAGACATCDFAFPGEVHLCPRCATAKDRPLSPKRSRYVLGGYALAVWCTLGLGVMMSGALKGVAHTKSDLEMVGQVIGLLVMLPALAGAGVSFAALEKRLANPPRVWGAVIWNLSIVGVLVLLTIVGTVSG